VTQSVGEATFALHCQAYGLSPESEYRFALPRKWRFDFAFHDQRLAVEIEGGTWINGRHNRGSSIEADMEKYNEAAALGWKVLRFTTDQVKTGTAIDTVMRALLNERITQ
jgi:very-short-patch-repair endonuclease